MPTVIIKRRTVSLDPLNPSPSSAIYAGFIQTRKRTVTTYKYTLESTLPYDAASILGTIADPCGDADYLTTNTVDPDGDRTGHLEFHDSVDEYADEGMSVVAPEDEAAAICYLNGYDIL